MWALVFPRMQEEKEGFSAPTAHQLPKHNQGQRADDEHMALSCCRQEVPDSLRLPTSVALLEAS